MATSWPSTSITAGPATSGTEAAIPEIFRKSRRERLEDLSSFLLMRSSRSRGLDVQTQIVLPAWSACQAEGWSYFAVRNGVAGSQPRLRPRRSRLFPIRFRRDAPIRQVRAENVVNARSNQWPCSVGGSLADHLRGRQHELRRPRVNPS